MARRGVTGCGASDPAAADPSTGEGTPPSPAITLVIVSESTTVEDPLRGWDPRRRAALERLQSRFGQAGGDRVSLADDLVAERRLEAAAEDSQSSGE